MAFKIVNIGEVEMLRKIFSEDILYCLYINDVTPSDATVVTDLTEMTGKHGYSRKTITPANWTIQTNTSTGKGESFAPDILWSFINDGISGNVNVYGFFAVYASDPSKLLFVERFPSAQCPHIVDGPNASILISPRFNLYSES